MRLDERIIVLRAKREHEVEFVVHHPVDQLGHGLVHDIEKNIGIELHVVFQRFVHYHIERVRYANVQRTALQFAQIIHTARAIIGRIDSGDGKRQQFLASLRERHLMRCAVKEHRSQFFLQLFDCLRECALCYAHFLCCF